MCKKNSFLAQCYNLDRVKITLWRDMKKHYKILPLSKENIRLSALCLLSSLVFYSHAVYAVSIIPDLNQMLQNLSKTIPNLMELVTATSYVMGMFFMVKAIFGLKNYGEQRSSHSSDSEKTLMGALVVLFVGAGLFYLPSLIQAGLTTFWTEPNPYAYLDESSDPWMEMLKAVFLIVQLIGTIAFIRGLVILSHVGGGSHGRGELGKALAHLIGGILCINLYGFLQAVFNTLALGQI